jgi:hypothetical protein
MPKKVIQKAANLATKQNIKIVGIIAAIIAAALILNAIRKAFKKEVTPRDENKGKGMPKTSKDGSTERSTDTISEGVAKQISEQQLNAMDEQGTNEELLFSSLRGLNGKSLEKVYQAFGNVRYLYFGKSPIPKYGRNLNLFGWYKEELNEKEMDKMRDIWSKTNYKL